MEPCKHWRETLLRKLAAPSVAGTQPTPDGYAYKYYFGNPPGAAQGTPQAEEIAEQIRQAVYDLWKRAPGQSHQSFGQASWQGFVREETEKILRSHLPAQSGLEEKKS